PAPKTPRPVGTRFEDALTSDRHATAGRGTDRRGPVQRRTGFRARHRAPSAPTGPAATGPPPPTAARPAPRAFTNVPMDDRALRPTAPVDRSARPSSRRPPRPPRTGTAARTPS